jgi:integrase
MAKIRKRSWKSGGEVKTAWIVDYFDQNRERHIKTFRTRKAAEEWKIPALYQVQQGTHTADSKSIMIEEAAELWIARCERDDLEQSTLQGYRSHVKYHIKPMLGSAKLSRLTAPRVQEFVDQLLTEGRSRALTKKIISSLSSIIGEAQRRGLVSQNVAREVRIRLPKRERGRPEMPTQDELRLILADASGRWRPLIVTLIFTGLRGSEARGLKWDDVDLEQRVLRVRQRVDQWGVFGPPKSAAGTREIPLAPIVVNTLREWKLACPRRGVKKDEDGNVIDPGELVLVFPNTRGNVESHANILQRGFHPLQVEHGIVDAAGKAKFSLHALRHAAAALFIDHGVSMKRLQSILGHESIVMTADLYGYLFDLRDDDRDGLAQLGARVLA